MDPGHLVDDGDPPLPSADAASWTVTAGTAADERGSAQAAEALRRAGAVVFDLGDTLVRTRAVKWAHHKAVAWRFYGIELTDTDLARHWGKPFDEMITQLYRARAPVDRMREANLALEVEFPKTVAPGARELVTEFLDAGVEVGVVTSTNTGSAVADLRRTGFPVDRLRFVHGADRTAEHKPCPGVFAEACAVLAGVGVGRAGTVYVGDDVMDLRAARGAGLGFVGVATGGTTGEWFTAEGADWAADLQVLRGEIHRGPG